MRSAAMRPPRSQVNKYPGQRTFTAIGTGGADFRATMLAAVESVVGTVHMECVSERPSSGGKYVSVRIGPVWVQNADQVRRAADAACSRARARAQRLPLCRALQPMTAAA